MQPNIVIHSKLALPRASRIAFLIALVTVLAVVGCAVPVSQVSPPVATQVPAVVATQPPAPAATQAPAQPTEVAAQEPTSAIADELVIAVGIEPVSMDAWRAFAETGGPGFRSVVEQLVARDFDTGQVVPLLATSWKWIDDKTIEFTLRQGLTFHDDSPFNAEAAAASINHTFDEKNAFDLLDFLGSMSAEAVDEFTLRVSTPEPDPILLEKMEFVSLGSAQQLAADPDSYSTNLIGTGPYRFAEWRRGDSLIYETNPDWWGIGKPEEAGGQQSFQRVVYRILQEDQVRTAAL